MTVVSEIERTELVNQLVATIGEGPAETLMKCVLPEGRDQLATKEDLRVLAAKMATKEDLAEFATKKDLQVLAAELRTEMANQARVFFMTMTVFMVTIWGTLAAQFFV